MLPCTRGGRCCRNSGLAENVDTPRLDASGTHMCIGTCFFLQHVRAPCYYRPWRHARLAARIHTDLSHSLRVPYVVVPNTRMERAQDAPAATFVYEHPVWIWAVGPLFAALTGEWWETRCWHGVE